jgi:hypothetical protein
MDGSFERAYRNFHLGGQRSSLGRGPVCAARDNTRRCDHDNDQIVGVVSLQLHGRRSAASLPVTDMQGAFLDGEGGFFHSFAQSGMRVNRAAEIFRTSAEFHHGDCFGD